MARSSVLEGVVVVDKPARVTSHDVVRLVRQLCATRRVGHTGTLDPDATGVLVLCLGRATRLAEYLSASRKNYVAEVVFGIETDTLDASGQVLAERDASTLTESTLRCLLVRFQGTIQQVPPMVSALHHEGKRLYELARAGIVVERPPRAVVIDQITLRRFTPGVHPAAELEITCSTGTYIRSLAADLGTASGTGGTMRSLRRTWVGADAATAFTLAGAYSLDSLRAHATDGTLGETLMPPVEALRGWPQATLSEVQSERIRHGQAVRLEELSIGALADRAPLAPETLVALLSAEGGLVAVARVVPDALRPVKVF